MKSDSEESKRSYWIRRSAGIVSLIAIALTVLGLLMGREILATYSLLVFSALPYAAMIAHLNMTRVLSRDEKTIWREQLWSRVGGLIAVWAYLFAADLKERGRGFRPWSARTDKPS